MSRPKRRFIRIDFDTETELSVAQMERLKIATIASFDQDFDRFPQITRQEP